MKIVTVSVHRKWDRLVGPDQGPPPSVILTQTSEMEGENI